MSRAARALIRRPNTVLGSDSPRLAPPAPRSQPRPCARARRSARWLSAAPTPPAAARQVALFLPRACPEWVFALEGSRGHRMACRCRRRASPGLGWPARAAALPNARSGRRSQALFADIMMRSAEHSVGAARWARKQRPGAALHPPCGRHPLQTQSAGCGKMLTLRSARAGSGSGCAVRRLLRRAQGPGRADGGPAGPHRREQGAHRRLRAAQGNAC